MESKKNETASPEESPTPTCPHCDMEIEAAEVRNYQILKGWAAGCDTKGCPGERDEHKISPTKAIAIAAAAPTPASLAETKVLPRFPGYREMGEKETLADGDRTLAWNLRDLEPTDYIGEKVGRSGRGLYFRPITIDPAPHTAPKATEGHPGYQLKSGRLGTWSEKLAELKAEIKAEQPRGSTIEAAAMLAKVIAGAPEGNSPKDANDVALMMTVRLHEVADERDALRAQLSTLTDALSRAREAHAQQLEDAYREGFADGDSGKMPNAAWNRSAAKANALEALESPALAKGVTRG